MSVSRLQILSFIIITTCCYLNAEDEKLSKYSAFWNGTSDENAVIKFIGQIEQELERSTPTSILIVLGLKLETRQLKPVLKFPIDCPLKLGDDHETSPYFASMKLTGNESVVVFSPQVDNWTLVDEAQLSYLLSRFNQSRILIATDDIPDISNHVTKYYIERMATLMSNVSLTESVGLVYQNGVNGDNRNAREGYLFMEHILEMANQTYSQRPEFERPLTNVSHVLGTEFGWIKTGFDCIPKKYKDKLRSLLINLQPVKLEYKGSNWFTGSYSWEQKLNQISGTFQTEIPLRVAQLIDTIKSRFENDTADNICQQNDTLTSALELNSKCERLQTMVNEGTSKRAHDVIRNLINVFERNSSGLYDPEKINEKLRIASGFLQSRGLPLNTRWMSSFTNFSISCNQISRIMTFMSSLHSSFNDTTTKNKLQQISISTITHESVLNVMETVGLAKMDPQLKTAFELHPRHLHCLVTLVGRHTAHKLCGAQLTLFGKHQFDFDLRRFMDFVGKIDVELETWKPTSLMIVLGAASKAGYVKRVLNYPKQNIFDYTGYFGAVVNLTGDNEAIFVFPTRSGEGSIIDAAQLSYVISRVNKSRILIAPTKKLLESDDFTRSVTHLIMEWVSSTSLQHSVGVLYQSESEPQPEDLTRANAYLKKVISLITNKTSVQQTPSEYPPTEYPRVMVVNSEIFDSFGYTTNEHENSKLRSLITHLQPVELQNKEPKWFIGDCTWEEKLDEVSNSLQAEITGQITHLVESIQSHFIRSFIDKMHTTTVTSENILGWTKQCERLANTTEEASSDNIFDTINNIGTAFHYNPYETVDYNKHVMQYMLHIVDKFLRTRGLTLNLNWMASIHKFSSLCNRTSEIVALIQQLHLSLKLPETNAKLAQICASTVKNDTVLQILEAQAISNVGPELKSLLQMHPLLIRFFVHLVLLNARRNIQIRCEESDLKESSNFQSRKLVITGDYVALSDFLLKLDFLSHSSSDWGGNCNGGNVKQMLVMASEGVYLNKDLDAIELELDVTFISPQWHEIGYNRTIVGVRMLTTNLLSLCSINS